MHGPSTHAHSTTHPPHSTHSPIQPHLGLSNRSNRIIFELIEIIWFCLKIYDLWRLPNQWVDVWLSRWMGGVMSNHYNGIHLDLMEINWFYVNIYDIWRHCGWVYVRGHVIWFCLQIYDLWRHLHAYTTHCRQSLAIEMIYLVCNCFTTHIHQGNSIFLLFLSNVTSSSGIALISRDNPS